MKKLPILYKKNNNGSINYWSIKIYRSMQPVNSNKWAIETEFGQKDTDKPQITVDFVLEGKNIGKKNETSVEKQAYLDAKSKWNKKKKTGYIEDLKQVESQDIGAFVQAGVRPMLAEKFRDCRENLVYPAICDRKFNGGRVIGRTDCLFTRKGEVYKTLPHIEESLKELFKKYPNLVLDGEGYNHEYRYKLNEVMSILRKTKHITSEDIKKSKEKIKFYVYDGYNFGTVTQESELISRRCELKKILKGIPYIEFVEGELVNSEKELLQKYEEYLADGYEGAMYRDLHSPYVNKRTKYLVKVKPEDDDEAIILDIQEGSGNWAGTGKRIVLKWQDKEFAATLVGTYEEARQFLKDKKKWIGKEVTFLYIGLTGLGVPNYARVDYNNCLKK